jgi:ribosomal protein S25
MTVDNNDRRKADKAWRDLQESKHAENIRRMDALTKRLDTIDRHVLEDKRKDVELMKMVSELQGNLQLLNQQNTARKLESEATREAVSLNTAITESIKKDTAAIVAFSKGVTLFRRFMIWFVPFATALISVYVTWNVKK